MRTLLQQLPHWRKYKRSSWILLLVTLVPLLALTLSLGYFPVGVSAQEGPKVLADLGDAPDSDFNHYGVANTAYFSPSIMGHFPTVWGGTPSGQPFGPMHWDASQIWLGDHVSFEDEADLFFDEDGVNNILTGGADNANEDRLDDGWLDPEVPFVNCQTTTLKVRVSVTPGMDLGRVFLNVWYDGNRDGDWRDTGRCQEGMAHEWIVQDFLVDTSVISGFQDIEILTQQVLDRPPNPNVPHFPYWIRFSLSEQPAPEDPDLGGADGRGPEQGYALGETEDYLIRKDVPPLIFEKHAETKALPVEPGDEITYTVMFTSFEGVPSDMAIITDAIPNGTVLFTDSVVATTGDPEWNSQANVITWYVPLPSPITPTLRFKVQVLRDLPPCGVPPIKNRAYLDLYPGIPNLPIVSHQVRTPGWICSDLGDAPDSDFNHHGVMTNTAYLTPTRPGHFPTVWRDTPQAQPSGPMHADAMQMWLGDRVSYEEEADILLDLDPTHNILERRQDVANLDHLDDGWLNPDVPFFDCEPTTLTVRLSKAVTANVPPTMYLNVWFDGNRDGDWADQRQCSDDQHVAFEWIVRDLEIATAGLKGSQDFQVPTWLVLNDDLKAPAWVRFTLSEQPAPLPPTGGMADGRGLDFPEHYALGETEDYIAEGLRPPEVGIIKEVEGPSRVPPGGEIPYAVHVMNHGPVPAFGLVITDAIPFGTTYISGSLRTSKGMAGYDPDHNMVRWTLDITDTVTETLHFNVKVWEQEIRCEHVIHNEAFMHFFPDAPPLMDETRTPILCSDLGDAPDSDFNHHLGAPNTAYSVTGVLGHFPTVWGGTPITQPAGPMHFDATQVWLGRWRSFEEEADIGVDLDGIHNILELGQDNADNDHFDDGWLNRNVPFSDCRETTLKVRVSRQPGAPTGRMFLNVWFDGRHDGDWDDWRVCPDGDRKAFEWIVRNFVVDTSVIKGYQDLAVPTWLVMNTAPDAPAWVRFTLSEAPVPTIPGTDIADGRGPHPPERYKWGETEDYIYRPMPPGEPGEIVITKTASITQVKVGEVFTYSVTLSHVGGTGPAFTVMTDTLPPVMELVRGPFVTEIVTQAVPLFAYTDGKMVGWRGNLSPGAKIRIDFLVRPRFCPQEDAQRVVINTAEALQVDGSLIRDTAKVTLDCVLPEPPKLDLAKHVVVEDAGGLLKGAHIVPGQPVYYHLTLTSTAKVTHTVHISDVLPPGVFAVGVSASSGQAYILHNGRAVGWDGEIGPANRHVVVKIRVKLDRERVRCEDELINRATWFVRLYEDVYAGESNPALLRVVCHDLGDAPDSTNHFSPTKMTAYPNVAGRFPTVFEVLPPERGPLHLHTLPLHLGPAVSFEDEADIGPDVDGHNNLEPPRDKADLDKADDGVDMRKLHFKHCERSRFPVTVSIDPHVVHALAETDGIAFLNVWADVNRDGDWNDAFDCEQDGDAPEHIVIDFPVDVAKLGPGLHTILVPTSGPVYWPPDLAEEMPSWLRFTLSEVRSPKPLLTSSGLAYGDGRGHDKPFRLGETEDYIYFASEIGDANPMVMKHGWITPFFDHKQQRLFWFVGWAVAYRNVGIAPTHNVQVVDTHDPHLSLWHQFIHPPVPSMAVGNLLTYNVGALLPGQGGFIYLSTRMPFTVASAGMVLTNTVMITGTQDADLLNNTSIFTVRVPLLPPRILYPRPGTDCTGTFTITGWAQPGVDVEVYVNSVLTATVPADPATGRWSHKVSLPDGTHTIQAVAVSGAIHQPSPIIVVIVDTSLRWSPLSLRFVDAHGGVIFPRDATGRMDESGWRIPLGPGQTYTASVRLCCTDPNAKVTLELPLLMTGTRTIDLTDPDGDRLFVSAPFTTPHGRMRSHARICVTCYLIRKCSDGEVTIDPYGTVYDVTTGNEVVDATVACYEAQESSGEEESFFSLWNAGDYGQENPQTTGDDGYFSFFTPPGTYQLDVAKADYQAYRSQDLVVTDEPVHHDVYLTPELSEPATYTVTMGATGFDPAVLEVEPGAIVRWVNLDTEIHATVSLTPAFAGGARAPVAPLMGWHSGVLDPGDTYDRQLSGAAEMTYTYYDPENPLYEGVILVRAPAPAPAIHIVAPEDGTVIAATNGMSVTASVEVEVENFTFTSGYWNLWVDGEDQGAVYTYTADVDLSVAAQHVISAELRDADDQVLATDVVTVEVVASEIRIVSPEDGAVFTATNGVDVTIPITVETTHFDVPSDGYWFLWIDGVRQGPPITETMMLVGPIKAYMTYADLSVETSSVSTTHVISAALVARDQLRLLGPVAPAINVTVIAEAPRIYLPLVLRNSS